MFFKKKKIVRCPVATIFQVIDEELAMGICCDIEFIYKDKTHSIGVYGDDGNTYKNVLFYFDKEEFMTRQELIEHAVIGGKQLVDIQEDVIVTECDGCYPDSTAAFRELMEPI